MRICSLVPAATEVLFALGLGDLVVGVTHECDWPPEASEKPIVTASLVQTGDLASGEIDAVVAATARDGMPLYAIEEEQWAAIDADVVVTQELCAVCAVSTDQVEGAVRARPLDVGVLDYSPSTLPGIQNAIGELGSWLGAAGRGGGAAWRECRAASTVPPPPSWPSRPRRASSSPSGSSRRTLPGTGSRTWSWRLEART